MLFPTIGFGQIKSIRLQPQDLPAISKNDPQIIEFINHQPDYSELSPELKDFYYLINYARAYPKAFWKEIMQPVLDVYPQFKGSYSKSLETDLNHAPILPFFALNDKLLKTAANHSLDITKNNESPSHISSNGSSFQDRIKKAGIIKCAGENICVGQGDVLFSVFLLYLDYNLPSLGHRKALLNPDFTNVGLGISFFKNQQYFIVQDFSCAQ